jgi:hypothetical protein
MLSSVETPVTLPVEHWPSRLLFAVSVRPCGASKCRKPMSLAFALIAAPWAARSDIELELIITQAELDTQAASRDANNIVVVFFTALIFSWSSFGISRIHEPAGQ